MKPKPVSPPKENLFRAVYCVPVVQDVDNDAPAISFRAEDDDSGRTLQLQWYVADRWAEIDSWYEGHFMERIQLGAAKKTISENRANMRILLQHGRDPQLGQKPIAPIDLVEENEIGGYSEGRLFDGLDPLVVDGIRAGQYGASFRFRVMREDFNREPGKSEHNPNGIPERTIKEMAVQEFGPVTWGAYAEASAGVRSITDEMLFGALRDMPPERLSELADFWREMESRTDLEGDTAPEDAPSEPERREQETSTEPDVESTPRQAVKDYLNPKEAAPEWML